MPALGLLAPGGPEARADAPESRILTLPWPPAFIGRCVHDRFFCILPLKSCPFLRVKQKLDRRSLEEILKSLHTARVMSAAPRSVEWRA